MLQKKKKGPSIFVIGAITLAVIAVLLTQRDQLVSNLEFFFHPDQAKVASMELDQFQSSIDADKNLVTSKTSGPTLRRWKPTPAQMQVVLGEYGGVSINRFFVEQECGFKDDDTIASSIDIIAKCISNKNEIIVNQRKALLWGEPCRKSKT